MSSTGITFTRIQLTGMIGCGVPVLPGTSEIAAPLEDRTELCAVDAHWLIGLIPTCDHHVRLVCEMTEIDWPGLVAEAERKMESAERPWADRQRHSQADAREHLAHFRGACA
jgi:hypothetical protein